MCKFNLLDIDFLTVLGTTYAETQKEALQYFQDRIGYELQETQVVRRFYSQDKVFSAITTTFIPSTSAKVCKLNKSNKVYTISFSKGM